jgi:hypothetical protein
MASSFHSVDTLSADGYWKTVAVPSRLYTPVINERPLAGVRIASKDIFRLSGIKASLNVHSIRARTGSRSHLEAPLEGQRALLATIGSTFRLGLTVSSIRVLLRNCWL